MLRTRTLSPTFAAMALLLAPGLMSGEADGAFLLDAANGHYYGLTAVRSDWATAEATAVAMGGHLVAINDANEERFLIDNFFQAPVATASPFWIGLNDIGHKGIYNTWTTGEAVTYTDFNPGEPNNFGVGEDYIAINWHFAQGTTSIRGTWNDNPLNGTRGLGGRSNGPYFGIVEISAAQVPEPSSVILTGLGLLATARLARWRCDRVG